MESINAFFFFLHRLHTKRRSQIAGQGRLRRRGVEEEFRGGNELERASEGKGEGGVLGIGAGGV